MRTRMYISLVLLLVLSGCGALQREADEFGTSVFARGLSICDGEMWVSNEASEKLCIRRSNEQPNTFLITQDVAEYWADFFATLAITFVHLYLQQEAPDGFNIYADYLDDDTPAKWRKAANQYTRKHYGAKAAIVEFERLEAPGGYIFHVKPGDQIPPWEEKEIPEFVLASQMTTPQWQEPDKYSYAQAGHMIEKPLHDSGGRPRNLTAMLDKAIKSSRRGGREAKLVRVEVLDPASYQRYVAASGSQPLTPASLTN